MPGHADKICLALDLHDERQILSAVDEFRDLVGYFKINSAFTLFGPTLVTAMIDAGARIFLDIKLHDIPNTLDGYGEAVTQLGVHIVTVHTAGGRVMLERFIQSADATGQRLGTARPKLIGISLLTSIDRKTMNDELNIPGSIEDEVLRRGMLAATAGLDGLVCSAGELGYIKEHLPTSFYYVTPGVRPSGSSSDDHLRIVSYGDAIQAGSNLLVVGRAVLGSRSPRDALLSLHDEIAAAGG
ncbi:MULTISPECIES: orotidine-5'-phosphate decarboxylase [unclassified Bradyrhizobium]|uniref:orotidine-5'-phosphate decarboxylase n=1 Tax=unclassified Bradyrhizobium TaxID=2631580 RepID=UPI002916CAB2|nr:MULTISPECIES: orotidine-5'-phosphate decarboxylase [unclassified Bradyrhizobium]